MAFRDYYEWKMHNLSRKNKTRVIDYAYAKFSFFGYHYSFFFLLRLNRLNYESDDTLYPNIYINLPFQHRQIQFFACSAPLKPFQTNCYKNSADELTEI